MASGEVRLFLEHAGAVGLAVCLATLLDGAAPQSGIFGIGAGSEEFLLSLRRFVSPCPPTTRSA